MKIATAAVAALIAVLMLIGGIGQAVVKALFGSSSTQPSQEALADIPADYLALYRQATSVCPSLDWSILAAIGKIETNHGRSTLPGVSSGENYAGAGGPMQFLQSTFDGVVGRYALPAGGATPPSRYNPHDAIYAAAYYLCDSGAPKDLRKAIFAYNHADWYVDEVLAQAKKYGDALVGTGDCKNLQAPTPAAIMAINFACGQLGLPYQWGGNGPAQGDKGFDCSGLTMAAYNAAGISLPRTAQTQYNAGPLGRVPWILWGGSGRTRRVFDRHDLTDEEWARLEPLLPDRAPCRGGRWMDHRMVINAVLWRTRAGASWRDVPVAYGNWKTIYNRHYRWAVEGVWAGILNELRRGCDEAEGPDWTVAVDGTVVRAHQHAAGARHTPPTHLDTGGSVE